MASLTAIRDCADRFHAESLRIRLAEAGISAIITGTDMETALGLGGAGTMRLLRVEVPSEDAQRAADILAEDERRALEAGPWICSRCREQNEATFEICWSCSKPRTDDDPTGRVGSESSGLEHASESLTAEPTTRSTDDGNPYRPVELVVDPQTVPRVPELAEQSVDSLRDDVNRAFRAAVIGSFVFPPLVSLYSLFLLISLPAIAYHPTRLRIKIILTWLLNIALTAGWSVWWINQLL